MVTQNRRTEEVVKYNMVISVEMRPDKFSYNLISYSRGPSWSWCSWLTL